MTTKINRKASLANWPPLVDTTQQFKKTKKKTPKKVVVITITQRVGIPYIPKAWS